MILWSCPKRNAFLSLVKIRFVYKTSFRISRSSSMFPLSGTIIFQAPGERTYGASNGHPSSLNRPPPALLHILQAHHSSIDFQYCPTPDHLHCLAILVCAVQYQMFLRKLIAEVVGGSCLLAVILEVLGVYLGMGVVSRRSAETEAYIQGTEKAHLP